MSRQLLEVLVGIALLVLLNVTVRIVEAIKDHREAKKNRPLTPFEQELRRRIRKKNAMREMRTVAREHNRNNQQRRDR